MRISTGWAALAVGLTAGLAAAPGCGGGSGNTSTSSSSSSGGGSSTGTGGTGGGAGAPFTSHGAASYEAQTSIAATAAGSVVASWIGFFSDNTSAIGYAVSRDKGATWTAPAYVKSPGGRLASNPVVAADGQGRFFLAWLGFRPDAAMPDEHVYLSRLDDASATFGAPAVASDDGSSVTRDFDKPAMTVDADDNLLLTWADFTSSAAPALTFARSTDGATFTRSTIVADATFGNLAYLCVDASAGPSAPLHVVHLGAGGTLTLRTSTDQGKTWALGGAVPAASVVFQDPTCVAHGADLWIAYASGAAVFTPGKDSPGDAVQLVHSTDGGAAFGAPVTVSDGAAGTQYLFPAIVRGASGKLEIVYYQGTDGAAATLTRATSADGAAWATAALGPAGTFTLDLTLANWLGEYVGLAAAGGSTFVSYTENSQAKDHIGFLAVASP